MNSYKYNEPTVLTELVKTDTPHNTREILAKEIMQLKTAKEIFKEWWESQ